MDQLKECSVILENIKIDSNSDSVKETTPLTRKSLRTRSKPNKYGEFAKCEEPKQKTEYSESDSEPSDLTDEFCLQKPTALFSTDDVEGQDMFKFKSRHTKHDLQNVVKSTIYSPKTTASPLKTPRRKSMHPVNSPFNKTVEATPKHIKEVIKKRIIKEIESDSDVSDFSASGSDFVPEESDNESLSSASSNSSNEDQSEELPHKKVQIKRGRECKTKHKDSDYIVVPDNYFMMHSSKKIVTSDHTLERLKNFSLNDDFDQQENIQLSEEHRNRISHLKTSYEQLFSRWLYVLSENFNVVLYGVGSKRSVLHEFQQKMLQDYPCIVVNGFFPSLTLRSILESILIDLLENTHVPSNIGDVVNIIDTQLSEKEMDLFLIIHNIDGTMLRSTKTQAALASISQIKNVHTIATIDHINAPLLWDHSKLSKFRFTWWDVTTFMPYIEETSYENSLMTNRSGALQLSSLRSVYQSLTSNAKGIFNIIIQNQLENHKQTHYQGLPFRDLYSKSREQFLVSSDVALRAQLTEFLDHKLVKIKRSYDGSENLVIPIPNVLLQQFLEQQEN